MASNVLVFAERRDGQVKRPVLETLNTARGLADADGGQVVALALGPGAGDCAAELARFGADRVLTVENPALELYAAQAYAACLAQAAKECDAGLVLVPGTLLGRDLAARAAARLETACASDLISIEFDEANGLRGKRPIYSGQAIAGVAIPTARPAVATLRPNVFAAGDGAEREAAVEPLAIEVGDDLLRVRTTEVRGSEKQDVDVAEAGIVVAGGRGLKEAEHFSLIRDLAGALGGAVGASRAVVDAGWIPHAHQVGQTGKVVSPGLYIACGISGAIQHLAGMSSSKLIVAINKDPEAPIFKVADYGIVGDLFEVVPALTEAVRKAKA
ncbi:MAG: electron transfer flavoprotein subunit alpha/FixB family protein [bacterium]|nr:electron transfer flavoprotein subunit alpha/FixB family protein [bacterium]